MTSDEARNATILRWTLSAASWLYALWSGAVYLIATQIRARPLIDPRLILLHAALLGLAGTLLWKPRRWALLSTMAAAAGSVAFAAVDLGVHNFQAALVDASYAPLAAVLLYKSRTHS